jgi:hypothetical protein
MKKLFALLLALVVSVAGADTTTNVLGNTAWTGVTNGNLPANRMPGSSLLYDAATGTVNWSYSQATAAKTIAINNALSGTGVQVGGYNYTYELRNMNGDNRQGSPDTMVVTTKMTSNTGATLLTNTNTHNTIFDWTTFTGTQSLNSALPLSGVGNLSISFNSKDAGFWAGYFGPEVRNVGMSLNYTVVDPCIANPAANTGCPGYTTNIITSPNLLTTGSAYAINQALNLTVAGVKIHGFNYGYTYNVGGNVCTAFNQDGSCSWTMNSTLTVLSRITDNNNAIIYNQGDAYNTATSGTKNVTYLFPESKLIGTLGSFSMQVGGSGTYSVTNRFSRAIYTPDWCAQNPTYNSSCAGYNDVVTSDNLFTGTTGAQAYAINTALAAAGAGTMIHGFDYGYNYRAAARDCAFWDLFGLCITGYNYSSASVTTTLTNSAGATGYTETNTHAGGNNGISGTYSKSLRLNSSVPMPTLGTFSMTPSTSGDASITNMYSRAVYTPDPCTADPLRSSSCAGYAQAYHDQQCSFNPLFAVDCAGYASAYLTQRCSANALYDPSCPGYQQAYFTQQCTASALYDSQCPGYQQAYFNQQCTNNPLYSTQCTGYAAAYLTQQCSISPLYSNQCTGYAVAYHDQQCSISALFMSDCPGYQQAYFSQQCTANSLYSNQCPGYAVAYKNQQCTANPLYATDCSGYAVAYHDSQCRANPLYMSDCTGYAVAYKSQQCSISALYATDCPGYQQAYFNQQCTLNGLYDRSCPNYGAAYAAKQVLDAPKTTTATPTSTVIISTESNATVTSNPAAIAISDPVVSSAVSTPSTTSATSPTSVTSVISAPAAATSPAAVAATTPAPAPAPSAETKAEAKKTEGAVAKAAARGNAAAAAKEAATAAANATSMEAQVASQGLVVGLMGYVPGFSAYQNAIVPDTLANAVARQYHKPTVDNRNAQRRLTGASDARWQEMVNSQYRLGE